LDSPVEVIPDETGGHWQVSRGTRPTARSGGFLFPLAAVSA